MGAAGALFGFILRKSFETLCLKRNKPESCRLAGRHGNSEQLCCPAKRFLLSSGSCFSEEPSVSV